MRKRNLLLLFTFICFFVLIPGASDFAPIRAETVLPEGPEILYVDGVPIPPSVRPVLIVAGSDYQMGYQYYKQLIQIFGPWVAAREWPVFGPTVWSGRKIKRGGFSEKDFSRLKKYEGVIKQYTPEMIDFMRGMADGATEAGVPLSYLDVLEWSWQYPEAIPGGPRPNDCSGFAAWGSATKDGRLILGGGGDHEITFTTFEVTVMFFPDTGNNFIVSLPTGGGWHPGINNKGLAYVHHGGCCPGIACSEMQKNYGIPRPFATVHALRYADDAEKAKEMQLSCKIAGDVVGCFWADVKGDASIVECRGAERKAGDYGERDFMYASNTGLCKGVGKEGSVYIPHGGWLGKGVSINAITRNLEMWNLLHNYHGKIDLDFAKMMWRFAGPQPDYPSLEEADAAFVSKKGKGWNVHISELANSGIAIAIPDHGDEGRYFVHNGCAAKIGSPMGPRAHFYYVDATHSFFELKLASTPGKALDAAKDRAQYDLYYAHLELGKLGYSDCAYAPLLELFNKAKIEWAKGSYYRGLALSGELRGSDTVLSQGKSLRAFSKCQSLARQVYNSLVPPADSPDDLGLQKWFGDWGEWASMQTK